MARFPPRCPAERREVDESARRRRRRRGSRRRGWRPRRRRGGPGRRPRRRCRPRTPRRSRGRRRPWRRPRPAPHAATGRARHDHVELVGPQRLEHRRRLPQRPDDQDPPPVRGEVVEEHLGAGVGAGRVVGAVDDRRAAGGRAPRTAPASPTDANPSSTTSGASGDAKNASAAVSASEALSPWWAPWSGTNTSG